MPRGFSLWGSSESLLMSESDVKNDPLFFLVAGEASGDLLGARLMRALKKKADGRIRFAGVGGPRMIAEGIDLLFPQSDLAHMGLCELARHIPNILRRMKQTAAAVLEQKPVALITIDAPDFSFRLAKKLKGRGIPLIHYVAPTVWAWRPGRAKKIARFLDYLLALLPFEPPYFTAHGLACAFVGHPLVESDVGNGEAARFRERFAVPADAPLLALLPGSRIGEIKRLLPIFRETVKKLLEKHSDLQLVVPTVETTKDDVISFMKDWPLPIHFTQTDEDKYDAFAAAKAALACSGTVSVELAMAELPTVIAYRASPVTAFLFRSFIKAKYATLINIMQNRMVMPEFLQENCTPRKLAEAVESLLSDKKERAQQKGELAAIGAWLGRDQFVPSEKAAETVWRVAFPEERKPLRVLQIIPSMGTGGAEQACVDIAAALVSRGDMAFIVSSGGWRVEALEKAGACHIQRDVKTKNPVKIIRNAFWLADVLRKEKIDIVHARSRAPAWSAWLACQMTGCRFVTTFHAAYTFSCNLKKAYNCVMSEADRIIAISPFIARHIQENYGISEGKIALVNRGVDIEGLAPDAISAERKLFFRKLAGLGCDEKAILLPGRLSPIKGQDFFLRVLGRLARRGVALPMTLFVGDDQGRAGYSQELKNIVEEEKLQGKIKFVGACSDMAAAYASAILVVSPSKVPEGFGRVPVEAMAVGIPVIASNLGATQDTVLAGETGWLLPPNDEEAWADGVQKALTLSEEERKKMASAAQTHVAAFFDKSDMIAQTLAVYEDVVGG